MKYSGKIHLNNLRAILHNNNSYKNQTPLKNVMAGKSKKLKHLSNWELIQHAQRIAYECCCEIKRNVQGEFLKTTENYDHSGNLVAIDRIVDQGLLNKSHFEDIGSVIRRVDNKDLKMSIRESTDDTLFEKYLVPLCECCDELKKRRGRKALKGKYPRRKKPWASYTAQQ